MIVHVSFCEQKDHVEAPDAKGEYCTVCGKETRAFHNAEIEEKVRQQLVNDPYCY